MAHGGSLKGKVQRTELTADLSAAAATLRTLSSPGPRGVIGFCFGGFCTVLAMTIGSFAARAAFYGGGLPQGTSGISSRLRDLDQAQGELLAFFGGQDNHNPPRDVDRIRAALAASSLAHEVVVYEQAGHGFFCDLRSAFRAEPAARAWTMTLSLFERLLR